MAKQTSNVASDKPAAQSPLARVSRMVVCVLSMGMIYPNAFVEDVNFRNYDEAGQQEALKK